VVDGDNDLNRSWKNGNFLGKFKRVSFYLKAKARRKSTVCYVTCLSLKEPIIVRSAIDAFWVWITIVLGLPLV
jgi:hypothetical protein